MSEELILNEEEVQPGAPKWVVTFGDMMSLLLVFFVLLLSFANMDITKFKELMGSIKDAFGVQREDPSSLNVPAGDGILELSKDLSISKEQIDIAKTKESIELLKKLENLAEETGLEEEISNSATPDGVLMEIKGNLMFDPGEAKIKESALPLMKKIIRIIKKCPYEITVEGHTDNVPIRSQMFPSNWELSTSRAGSVVRLLLQDKTIDHTRFKAVGYADTKPLTKNDTPENRAKNRRVNFIFKISKDQEKISLE